MTTFDLGINTCFAVKRWPEPEAWAAIVRGRLGLDVVQHSLDLVELSAPAEVLARQAQDVVAACAQAGLRLHSTFTGLAAYSSNLLLDPAPAVRRRAEEWYGRVISFTASVGGRGTGGHIGAFSVRDWTNEARRRELEAELTGALGRLARRARAAGLSELYIENLAAAREPSTMAGIERLLSSGDDERAAVALCLDVGHQCVPGTAGVERDPYEWLMRLGAQAPVVQLQQTDGKADHHWPFTAATNRRGIIEAGRVLDAIHRSGAAIVTLILEVIPPFEADDDLVLAELEESAEYWRSALIAG